MSLSPPARARMGSPPTASTLFFCLFGGQAAQLVMSPVLPDVAGSLGVSEGLVGQARSLSGGLAVAGALSLSLVSRRTTLRCMLIAGLALTALGAALAAAAPTLLLLYLAQVPTGIGLALVLSGALAATTEWAAPGGRTRLLSIALLGQPTAWVVGMPIVGLLGDVSWRYALLAPLVPCVAALVAAGRRPAERRRPCSVGIRVVLRSDGVARWAGGEVLTYTAWCGTLVYAGALLVGSYGCSRTVVGATLAACGAAYVPGTLVGRRLAGGRARRWVLVLTIAAAPVLVLVGTMRPTLAVSGLLLATLSFLIGARTMAASAIGLAVGRESPIVAMGLRTSAVQSGYLLGGALGGLAMLAGGPATTTLALAGLLVAAAAVHIRPSRRRGEALDTLGADGALASVRATTGPWRPPRA